MLCLTQLVCAVFRDKTAVYISSGLENVAAQAICYPNSTEAAFGAC